MPGETIGRFEIRKILGRGAQSVVYLGFDPHLQREVALKTVRVATASEGRELLAEARTVGSLRHPNIVPVFEAGEHAGQPYLVFEFVAGASLEDRLKGGGLPPETAVGLLLPVLDALQYAHEHEVVHRDVKPSNILLTEEGLPRVMDFGIATKVAAEANAGDGRQLSGTPSYMAPEYLNRRIIAPSNDVFAAGLVLYEMLAGTPAIADDDIYRVMYRLAHEPVRLPPGNTVPEKLADVLHKALAIDPADRWHSAGEFRDALQAAMAPAEGDLQVETGHQATLEFLLRRMRHKSDFPALSGSVSAVNRIAGGAETENNAILSGAVLKDVALTNKILKMVNSAYYRQAGGGTISTVSRAVIILGFETIRNIAVALLLFENMQNKTHAAQLREEFVRAMMTAILAKNLAGQAQLRNVEEAFICAMFHNLGRLLAWFYFPEEAEEVAKRVAQKGMTEDVAASQVLGISYEELGIGVSRVWGFPDQIVQSQRKVEEDKVRPPQNAAERVRVLSAMAATVCDTVGQVPPNQRAAEMRKLQQRFGESLKVSDKHLQAAVDVSLDQIYQYAASFNLNVGQTTLGKQIAAWSGKQTLKPDGGTAKASTSTLPGALPDDAPIGGQQGRAAPGLPDNAETILAAGIQDISNSLVDDFKLNDLLRIILETMYRGIGFRRVLLAIRDGRTNQMHGRFGFGPDIQRFTQQFQFPLSNAQDVFQLVLSRGADLLITDVDDAKIRDKIPPWWRRITHARTFLLFPLMIKNKPVALIYAERDRPGDIVIPDKELSLLRTLRNQAVLAIKQTL